MPRIRAENIAAHKAATHAQILAAATDLFLSQGYAAISYGDIAAEIGVGRTTLYEYFPDKEAILVHLVENSIPPLVDEMIDGIPSGLGARERLGELILRNLEFVSDQNNLGTLIMREVPLLSPAAQDRVRLAHQRLEREVATVCEQAVASGEFRPLDPQLAGRIVSSTMFGALRVLLREDDPKQRLHEVADALLTVLFDGLAAGR